VNRRLWISLVAGCAALLVPAATASATPTVVRTGGPSRPADPKIAIVGTDQPLAGEHFRVVRPAHPGKAVMRGRLAPVHGSPAPWKHAYKANLTKLRKPGEYEVLVAGERSRPWVVRRSGSADAIDTVLHFLRANSDGYEKARLHGPAHLNDAKLGPGEGLAGSGLSAGEHINMRGGWMDAGDMIHFAQTTAGVTADLEAAARLDPKRRARLRSQADVGIRWLLKAHPAPGLFIAQVGDARDHDAGFRNPESDDGSSKPGIGTRIAYPGIGSDIAGKAATALALAADRARGPQRAKLIDQAEDWYEAGAAKAAPLHPLGAPTGGFYITDTWKDDMAGGAAALYRTTGEAHYLSDAYRYLKGERYDFGFHTYSFATFAGADLCGALGAPAAPKGRARELGCAVLRDAARDGRRVARKTAFGTPGEFIWGSTQLAASAGAAGVLAAKKGLYGHGMGVAAGARDYMLGRNPWGAGMIAGYGRNAPHKIHSWASVFGDGEPEGAVVGGPAAPGQVHGQGFQLHQRRFHRFDSKLAVYEDRRANYVNSEPAIDYAAPTILMLAALAP
jgi:endoglucanase